MLLQKILKFLYQTFAKPIFFSFTPDNVHSQMVKTGNFLGRYSFLKTAVKALFYYENQKLKQNILGINFKNPVGLSEGFDKDGDMVQIMPSVGFGFMQVGSVTLEPYAGNEKPWSTRLIKSKALTVNYGLKNIGVDLILEKIKKYIVRDIPLSISVGKTNSSKTVDEDTGIDDYVDCFKKVVTSDLPDIITLNISCPNTFGGEPFTKPEKLEHLLREITAIKTKKPLFIKMPINLDWETFKSLCEVAIRYKISGVIIGNLNKDRNDPAIVDFIPDFVKGNISGKPTEKLSNELIFKTYKEYGKKLVIIGVGGIFSAEDAYEKIKRGASLVQLVTGMIYEGPQLIGTINRGLVKLLEKDGYKNISDAIGMKTYSLKN